MDCPYVSHCTRLEDYERANDESFNILLLHTCHSDGDCGRREFYDDNKKRRDEAIRH